MLKTPQGQCSSLKFKSLVKLRTMMLFYFTSVLVSVRVGSPGKYIAVMVRFSIKRSPRVLFFYLFFLSKDNLYNFFHLSFRF